MSFNISPQTLKTISAIVIVIIFAIIIIVIAKSFASTCSNDMTYDKDSKKCRLKCQDGEIYYDDVKKCLPCPPGQSLFGTICRTSCNSAQLECGDYCYDPLVSTCIDNKLCSKSMSCKDNTICCENGQYCNLTTDTCTSCDSSLIPCGTSCCSPNQICTNGVCCDGQKCGNSEECCMGSCCGDQCCKDDEECDNGKCAQKCGNKLCNPDTEICSSIKDVNNNILYECVEKDSQCNWSEITYNPPSMNNNIPVCTDHNTNLFYCKNPPEAIMPLSRKSTVINKSLDSKCTKGNCFNKLSEVGLEFESWDETDNTCEGSFNCNDLLPSCDDKKCPSSNTNQCCTEPLNPGKYTGQICPTGQNCYYKDGKHICSRGWAFKQDPTLTVNYKKCSIIDSNDINPYDVSLTEEQCIKNSLSMTQQLCDVPPLSGTGDLDKCQGNENITTNVSCVQQHVAEGTNWQPPGVCYSQCYYTKKINAYNSLIKHQGSTSTKIPLVVKTNSDHKFNANGYKIGGDAFVSGSNLCPKGSYFYVDLKNKKAICSHSIADMEKNLTSVANIEMVNFPQKSYLLYTCTS